MTVHLPDMASPSSSPSHKPTSRFTSLRRWIGILLSLACVTWLVVTVDWRAVWQTGRRADLRLVLLALLLNLSTVGLRTVRWRRMFPSVSRPSASSALVALLIGQAINVLTPTRLGDLARAALVGDELRNDGGRIGVAYTLGTLGAEVALDLAMLTALTIWLLSQVALPTWWRGSGEALIGTAAVALTIVAAMVAMRRLIARLLVRLARRWPRPALSKLAEAGGQILSSLDALGQPARLFPVLACSVAIWTLYGAVNAVLLGAVGEPPAFLTALFLLVVLQLGVAVPSSPGRVGVFHYLCVRVLAISGVDEATAVVYAVLLHLISVVVPLALGGVLAWWVGVTPARLGRNGR